MREGETPPSATRVPGRRPRVLRGWTLLLLEPALPLDTPAGMRYQ